MGLIFEHQQPILIFTVNGRSHMDRTGIDFFALIQFGQQAALFQGLCTDRSNVHQGLRTRCCFLFTVNLYAGIQITLVRRRNCSIMDLDILQMGGESSVTAVVRPVCIHYSDLRNGRVTTFFVPKVVLQELQIIQIHGKSQLIQ